MTQIKFCGTTRVEDAREAASLNADFIGMIFAASPRHVDPRGAREIRRALEGDGARPRLVGVFGRASSDEIAATASTVGLDVVQLHADPTPDAVARVRDVVEAEVWAAVRVTTRLPDNFTDIAAAADAVLLDRFSASQLGGTGETFDWERVADALDDYSTRPRVVLAGGLDPDNVRAAVIAVGPDVVDVASGVESAPGVKDHEKMRAFARAVRGS